MVATILCYLTNFRDSDTMKAVMRIVHVTDEDDSMASNLHRQAASVPYQPYVLDHKKPIADFTRATLSPFLSFSIV